VIFNGEKMDMAWSHVVLDIIKTPLCIWPYSRRPKLAAMQCIWYRCATDDMIHKANFGLSGSALALVTWSVLNKERVLVSLVPRLVTTFRLYLDQHDSNKLGVWRCLPASPKD